MKKLILLFIAAITVGSGFCDEATPDPIVNDQYGYFSHGASFPCIYSLNFARRVQHNHDGYEIGIGGSPVLFAYEAHAFLNYLYFPKPNLDSEFYFGIGAQGGYASFTTNKFGKGVGFLAPNLVFGKSFYKAENDRRFVQLNVAPGFYAQEKWRRVPSLSVSYGYCF